MNPYAANLKASSNKDGNKKKHKSIIKVVHLI